MTALLGKYGLMNLHSNFICVVMCLGKKRTIVELGSSHDDSALFSLIQADYGLKSRQDFADALKNVSMRNKFHPVRELLDSLTWDGKEHIRSLLPEYLGAEDSDYTYQVMRLWMLELFQECISLEQI